MSSEDIDTVGLGSLQIDTGETDNNDFELSPAVRKELSRVAGEVKGFLLLDAIHAHNRSVTRTPTTSGSHTSSTDSQTCKVCKQPATKVCSACPKTNGHGSNVAPKIYYCSQECQKLDWSEHKIVCKKLRTICKDEEILCRAAGVLRCAYYAFRRGAFDLSIASVEVDSYNKSHVIITEGDYDLAKPFVNFPDDVIKDMDSSIRPMLYSLAACTDQFAAMHDVVKLIFKETDVVRDIQEVLFSVKNTPMTWTFLRPTGNNHTNTFPHCAFRIRMKNGTDYALDLAGAQYGYDEYVMPWDEYAAARIGHIHSSDPFGTYAVKFKRDAMHCAGKQVIGQDTTEYQSFMKMAIHQTAQHFTCGFNTGLKKLGLEMKSLLACRDLRKYMNDVIILTASACLAVALFKEKCEKDGGIVHTNKQATTHTEVVASNISEHPAGTHEHNIQMGEEISRRWVDYGSGRILVTKNASTIPGSHTVTNLFL